jgi:predicted permease
VRSFSDLRNTDAGFVADKRLIFDVTFQPQRFQNQDAVRTATSDMLGIVRGVAGVTEVGAISAYPLRGTLEGSLLLQFHGEPFDQSNPRGARQRVVSAGLFSAMGTKVVSGRDIGPEDASTAQRTCLVNRTFVKRYLAGKDPIGVQFMSGYPTPTPQSEVTIVGVIDDVRQESLSAEAQPAFYTPLSQVPFRRVTVVASTSSADIEPIETAIRSEVHKMDPTMAVDFELAREVVAGTLRRQELGMTLMLIFGSLAVILAAVGIYGVVAYAGAQRRDEMATRLALGATPGNVFWLVMRQGATLAAIGTVIGLVFAYLSGRVVSNKVYAVSASDPWMLTTAIALVVGITVLATMIPAFRSSRVSPARALRSE